MFILVCSFSTIILAEINSGDITTRPNMSGSPTLFHCTCWKLGISQQLLFIGLDYNDCPDPYIRKVNGLQKCFSDCNDVFMWCCKTLYGCIIWIKVGSIYF